ncbi:MAG: ASKHA domain-containing protein [Desulfobacteraceae bacterium]|nr:ASKHA domain-containing protein [Desulfobacteraceae bacterium]
MSDNKKKNMMINVTFQPSGLSAEVPAASLLTDALTAAGIFLPLDCGGNGTCGRCRVMVSGRVAEPTAAEKHLLGHEQIHKGWRLACQTKAMGDLQVRVPETAETAGSSWPIDESDVRRIKSSAPLIVTVTCEPSPPVSDDPRSDLGRIIETILEQTGTDRPHADHLTAAELSRQARLLNWRFNAFMRGSELVGIAEPGQAPLGMAVDLGSTKLAAYLVDLGSGAVVAARGRLNPQVAFGADVVTRLQMALRQKGDGNRLTVLIREALDRLAGELAAEAGVLRSRICEMTLVGNSVMAHLFLGLPLEQLGAPPFVAALDQAMNIKARELGLCLAPGAYLYMPPLVGGFVGSDNLSMIMAADLDRPGSCRLGLDIGTNTEVVVTVPDSQTPLFIASAPSGPTFEGAHLSSGMRAVAGAVARVFIQNGEPVCQTIDGSRPAGICGSGIIDAMATMLEHGIINHRGHLNPALPRVAADSHSIHYVLVPGYQSATGQDIVITQSDISQIQLAKAAINGAVSTLFALAGLPLSALSEIVLAGSFGSHFDVANARRIGLIPGISGAVCRQVGNAAGRGAQMMLNDHESRYRALDIQKSVRYVELTSLSLFNSVFARSLCFPE